MMMILVYITCILLYIVFIKFYFSKAIISDLAYQLRYETPYGHSTRASILERLARWDLTFESLITLYIGEYLLEFVTDERSLSDNADGMWWL